MTTFLRQMKRLDKTLSMELDRKRGRYVIYRRDRRNFPRQILVIETTDGQFCRPSYEHIVQLYKMDSWQNKNLIKDMDDHNNSLDEEGNRKVRFLSNELSKMVTRSAYF